MSCFQIREVSRLQGVHISRFHCIIYIAINMTLFLPHALHAGGPGPEIPVAIDQFPTGELVMLTVTVSTEGGQTSQFPVLVTVQGTATAIA